MNRRDSTETETETETEFIYEQSSEEEDVVYVPAGGTSIFTKLCVLQCILLLIAVIWGLVRKIYWWNNFRIDSSLVLCLYVTAGLFICSFLSYIFRKKLPFMHLDWILNELYIPIFGNLSFLQCAAVAILSGLCEEVFFRGILCAEWGVVVSSLIFGILHLGHKKLIFSGVWIALIGGALALCYNASGNLLVPVLIHFFNNLGSFICIQILIKNRKDE